MPSVSSLGSGVKVDVAVSVGRGVCVEVGVGSGVEVAVGSWVDVAVGSGGKVSVILMATSNVEVASGIVSLGLHAHKTRNRTEMNTNNRTSTLFSSTLLPRLNPQIIVCVL